MPRRRPPSFSTYASYERRAEDWEFQHTLALHDVRIGAQQVKLAEDHVRVAGQERVIAEMEAENAQVIADFLANKFTSVELYAWMSDVPGADRQGNRQSGPPPVPRLRRGSHR